MYSTIKNKIFKIIYIILFSTYFSSAHDLSLEESFNHVLKNNDGLKASKLNIDKAKKIKDATNMLYFPNIDIIGNYTYISDPMILDVNIPVNFPNISGINHSLHISSNNLAYGVISIMYPIYTGGKRLSTSNIARLNIDDANFLFQLKKINLFENLVKNYYGLILNIEILKTLIDVENGHKAHLENAIQLERNGQIAKLEYLSAQVAYDKAKNKTLEAKDSLEIALLSFKTILQDEYITNNVKVIGNGVVNLNLTSSLEISKKELENIDSYKQKVLNAYPMLKSIETKKLQANELKNIEFSNFLPTIGLYGGYFFKDNNLLLNKIIPNWNIGIMARFSILDNNGRIFRYQASKIAQNEANHLYSQAKQDILLLTETTYKEVLSAKDSYLNLSSSLELAKENLRLQEEAFKNGMNDSAKVSDARNMLSGVIIELKRAEYKYIIALAKLCALSNDINSFYTFY